MKKLNESQQIILDEEMNRAILLKKAKNMLPESRYQHFKQELAILEEKAEKSGVSKVELYEGIFGNLYNTALNATQGLSNKAANFAQRNETSEQIRDRLKQVLEDTATKELFSTLEGYREKTADELKNDPKYQGLKTQADGVVRETQRLFNLLGRLDPLLAMRDETEEIARAAETLGMKPEALLKMYRGAAAAEAGGAQGRTSKNTRIQNAYNRFRDRVTDPSLGGEGGDVDTEPVDPTIDPDTEVTEPGKPITVRSIQRPLINLVQRVAAAEGIDVSVKQAQDIAIAITKNLVNQMRANGVEFKGVTSDLRESFKSQIVEMLSEAFVARNKTVVTLDRLGKDGNPIKNRESLKDMANYIKSGREPSPDRAEIMVKKWFESYDELKRKISDNNLNNAASFQAAMEESKGEANSMIDFLDIGLDVGFLIRVSVLKGFSVPSDRVRDLNAAYEDLKKTFVLYSDAEILTGDSRKGYKLSNEYRRMYIDLKKKDEKAPEKDLSLATPKEGEINISQTVAKAVQAGGLDREVAQKITPILKGKIEKLIKRHLGADVQFMEEKINRYVNSVIKEIKQ